jgi:hypothetical protein
MEDRKRGAEEKGRHNNEDKSVAGTELKRKLRQHAEIRGEIRGCEVTSREIFIASFSWRIF